MASLPPLPLNAWLRYDLTERVLRRLPDVRSVLELGAGEGGFAARLARRYDYLGVEPDPHSHARAAERLARVGSGHVVCGDASALDSQSTFDLVCAFEVLEHIEDDRAILREWRARVRDGGWILLTVPAHERRFGAHDRVVGHYRRYDPAQLAALLREAGYEDPVVLSYGFPFGYLLEFARNVIGRLAHASASTSMDEQTAASGRWLQPPEWVGRLTRAVSAPFRLIQRPLARTGLGTGLVAVARRP
jgi:SAM-dependent methyltransferase